MPIVHPRMATFAYACLFASILCFAQTDSLSQTRQDTSATPVADAAIGSTTSRKMVAHNIATDSLERAVENEVPVRVEMTWQAK